MAICVTFPYVSAVMPFVLPCHHWDSFGAIAGESFCSLAGAIPTACVAPFDTARRKERLRRRTLPARSPL